MTNRVVIVTGANSGIGLETTRILCEKGYDVIMACRSEDRANRAIEKLKRQVPNALATYMQLDLASLESIRKFVDAFHATEKKLNILINNAGVVLGIKDTKRQYTKDNFELIFGTNHLGHFLLTNLLLDDLKKAAAEEGGSAHIVVVASSLHDPEYAKKRFVLQPMDFENQFLFKDGTYSSMQAYKNSKQATIMFTYELARKLEGTGVTVNALCPGFVPMSDLLRNEAKFTKFYSRYVLHGVLRFTKATRSIQQAGNAVVSLAIDEKFKDVTGKFFRDGQEVKSSEESLDEEKQKKLWELSGGYTHLEGFEPIDVPPPPAPEEKTEKTPEVEANGEAAKEGEEKKTDGKEDAAPKGDGEVAKEEVKADEKVEESKDSEPKKEAEEKKEEDKKEEDKKEEEKKAEEKKEEPKAEESEKLAVEAEEKESKTEVPEQEVAKPEPVQENGNPELSAADKDAEKKEEDEEKKEGASEAPAEPKPAA